MTVSQKKKNIWWCYTPMNTPYGHVPGKFISPFASIKYRVFRTPCPTFPGGVP